ncbi:hypothetical protein, partial [Streptomyces sp. SID8380]|uniref:hypothetical protein n=1 Tax=Streptomyces sp. SID8380 TaxID=2690360 RepID=UPI001F25150E
MRAEATTAVPGAREGAACRTGAGLFSVVARGEGEGFAEWDGLREGLGEVVDGTGVSGAERGAVAARTDSPAGSSPAPRRNGVATAAATAA